MAIRGVAADQVHQRPVREFLGLDVGRRVGLLKHQDARVTQDGAGNGDALALPHRQAATVKSRLKRALGEGAVALSVKQR